MKISVINLSLRNVTNVLTSSSCFRGETLPWGQRQLGHLVEMFVSFWAQASYRDLNCSYDELCLNNNGPFSGKLMSSTEEHTVQIYQPAIREGVLQGIAVPFQQQEGVTDCGLFSIAAIHHSALSQDLAKISFCQDELWQHLIECFEHTEISPFPPAPALVHRNKCKHVFFLVNRQDSYDTRPGWSSVMVIRSGTILNM